MLEAKVSIRLPLRFHPSVAVSFQHAAADVSGNRRGPNDIHALDGQGRSALGHVVWSAPPAEDIFPLVDRLLAAGAGKAELTRTLADACDSPQWRDGLVKRGANPTVCNGQK